MQFTKYDVSLGSSSLAFWLEGMWEGDNVFFSLLLRGLHKDIMINIQGTPFVTIWYIMNVRGSERDGKLCKRMLSEVFSGMVLHI